MGYDLSGTKESVDMITPGDLKAFYERNFSPSVSRILVAGNVTKEEVLEALKPLEAEWQPKDVEISGFPAPAVPEKSQVFFVDIPGSRQSVFYCGYPALTRDNPDYVKADFANYRMGGAFTAY